ncbi:MAG: PorV/PorQ family protein [Candidatus Eisenbacteria bacterium]|nr:PorV/PorQ family protein [Candidatus Eisenbacteria bacterium]
MRSDRFAAMLALPLILLAAVCCSAQGTSGSQFLGIGIGARAMGMGGATVSLNDDGTALFWNPAGLTQVRGHRFSVSHIEWLADATYQSAGYAMPFGDEGALGFSIEQGSVEWDNTGEGMFDAGDFSAAVGYGRRLRPNLGVGGGLRYISSTLGDDSARSYGVDLGVAYRLSPDLLLGAAVRNVGPGLTFRDEGDPLPTTLAVGGAYRWNDITVALDLEKQNDLDTAARMGAEYSPFDVLALRGGYVSGSESALGSLTAGLGLRWDASWAFDYAYRSSELGGTHQVSLSAGFGEAAGLSAPAAAREAVPVEAVPKSNMTVLADLTREVVTEAVERMGLPEGSELRIVQGEQNDASWLVHSVILEELTSRGHVVMASGSDATGSERPRFEVWYKIITCQTTIPRSWREWVVGPRKVERKSRCDIHFRLSDENSAVVWAGNVERERREIIRGDRLSELATPGQPFVSPEVAAEGWDKMLEPVVVAGIVGGLIYLFYTSRSTD